ncbi:Gag-pro-like protein [Gossypium australe]|uniref:Gag-pro-like protein n=1 Tax=Gossypium australe TaxID=47621 RepID=A0A5B6WZV8_9ROSI|nr:Gag-pro-like protein [Gossypium australe]
MENADYRCGVDAKDLNFVPDLAFMKQYSHVTDMTPDRITLQNMEEKQSESFRQYAQIWRGVVMQVQPPLLEKETIMLFKNTLKAPFINYMFGRMRSYNEFYAEEGHEIQECTKFRALVQSLMDNKELEFFEMPKAQKEETSAP